MKIEFFLLKSNFFSNFSIYRDFGCKKIIFNSEANRRGTRGLIAFYESNVFRLLLNLRSFFDLSLSLSLPKLTPGFSIFLHFASSALSLLCLCIFFLFFQLFCFSFKLRRTHWIFTTFLLTLSVVVQRGPQRRFERRRRLLLNLIS